MTDPARPAIASALPAVLPAALSSAVRPTGTGILHRAPVRVLLIVLALIFLNAALTFDNLWPTPAVKPSPAISLEFLALLGVVLSAATLSVHKRWRVVRAVALIYTLLVFGRYAEVTLPALFGRPINLYWDGRHIPGLLMLAWKQTPLWQAAAMIAAATTLVLVVHHVLHRAWDRVAVESAGSTLRVRRAAACATGFIAATGLAAMLIPPLGGLPVGSQTHLRDYVVQPVSATLLKQGGFVATALSRTADRSLPSSPAFAGNVGALHGADLILVFLESYGAAAFDNDGYASRLAPRRAALEAAVADEGRHVVSAFVRSPTFGGGSWLAHASLLSGIDVSNPADYDLLLTTGRPTLVSHFRSQGYGTVALMPGIRADWPEGSFYGYDTLLDSRGIDYRGPDFGYWRIPDQFSIARFAEHRREAIGLQPQFLVFPTVTSHIPFGPVPPYQDDWSRLSAEAPFSSGALSASLAHPPDWLDLGPAYVQTLSYAFDWVTGYVKQPVLQDYMMILVGDHQPAASVAGQDASWDVPVHLITSDAGLADRFTALGFTPGITPRRPALGAMSDLTRLLLQALSLQ